MMKRFLLLAVLAACGKPNEVNTLHHEAIVVAKSYQPQLDELDKRLQTIFKRGTTIPGNLPGIEIVTPRLTEARDGIAQLRGIVGTGTGKSAVETQADEAAKAGKIGDLQKLIADTERTLSEGTTIIRDDLTTVENWIAQYEQGTNRAGGTPPPEPPAPEVVPPPAQTPPAPTPPAPAAGGNPAQPAAPTGAQPAAPKGAGAVAPKGAGAAGAVAPKGAGAAAPKGAGAAGAAAPKAAGAAAPKAAGSAAPKAAGSAAPTGAQQPAPATPPAARP